MGIQIKLILAACMVHFGFMSVQLHNARNQVQNLFHSIARSDTKKSEIYHEILKQDVVKEQQAFDTIRKELRVAQNRNTYKRSNFYKKDDVSQTVVPVKRDTKNNYGEYKIRTLPSYSIFCNRLSTTIPYGLCPIVILSHNFYDFKMECMSVLFSISFCGTVTSTDYFDDFVEHKYKYVTVDSVKETPNATMFEESSERRVEYLCRLPKEERIKVCKEALQHEFAIEHGIKYMETEKLDEEKIYTMFMKSDIYSMFDETLVTSACSCPTSPRIYLKNPRKIDEVDYEYEYVTTDYAKEVNTTMLREPVQYLCRLPDKERIKICKEALEHKFAIEHGIKYVETEKLGEAKMYAFRINSGPYLVDCPIIISACTCPTSPTIYLRNKFEGFNVQAYMVLPGAEGEWNTTSGYETNTMLGPDISAAQIFQ